MSTIIQIELEFFELSERRPSGVQALLVQVDGLLYPAAYSDKRGFVWADGTPVQEGAIQQWAIFPASVLTQDGQAGEGVLFQLETPVFTGVARIVHWRSWDDFTYEVVDPAGAELVANYLKRPLPPHLEV